MPDNVSLRVILPKSPLLSAGQYEQAIMRFVGRRVTGLLEEMATVAREHTPVAFGVLRTSIATKVMATPVQIHGEVFTGAQAPYAQHVEEGTRPGRWVPIRPLELWARRVLGSDESAPYRVRWAIYRRGTRARRMFATAYAQIAPRAPAELLAGVTDAAVYLQGI